MNPGGIAGLGILLAVLCVAAPAQATFPGANGRIAYTWSSGGESYETGPRARFVGIVSIRPDGSDRRLIARGGFEPGYSPNGRRIAFLRDRRLWVARADGARARPVTPRRFLAESFEWAPRGGRLAVERDLRGVPGSWLYRVESDGRGLRRLAKAPSGLALSSGAWSPDGKAVVYQEDRNAARPFVQVVRGGRVTRLAVGGSPTWSRLGLVAYQPRYLGKRLFQVCVTRPGLRVPIRCFGSEEAGTSHLGWSPDGRRLIVMTAAAGPQEIWTMRLDGTIATRAPLADAFPISSPDGRWLAFSDLDFRGPQRLGFYDLAVMRTDGTGRRRLVGNGQALSPDWQPRLSRAR